LKVYQIKANAEVQYEEKVRNKLSANKRKRKSEYKGENMAQEMMVLKSLREIYTIGHQPSSG
jgi:hypothetical protein